MPLIYLDLSNNSFSNELPDCWGYFDRLSILHLENNNLWGNLPNSIGSLNQLEALHLSNNNLSGELPMSLLNCTSLIILDLADNSLSGYIPSTLGNVVRGLGILILRGNQLSGSLPSSLCHLSRLHMLDLSKNRIRGTIPICIYNLTAMVSRGDVGQEVFYDILRGFLPYSEYDNALIMWKGNGQKFDNWYLMGHVKAIDLSNNMLEGQIPETISNLVGLIQINLSRNHLNGAITTKIGQLTSLESLDLSHNQLSGEIPISMAKMYSLGCLNLSFNNLSGKIPEGTQLQGFDTSSYTGNPGLCGAPLPKCPRDEPPVIPRSVRIEQHKDNFMLGMYISVLFGFITGFWVVCGTLVVKTSWRHAFFRFYDNIRDRIYVIMVVNIAGVWRRS